MSIDERIKIIEAEAKQQKLDAITFCDHVEIIDRKVGRLAGMVFRLFKEIRNEK